MLHSHDQVGTHKTTFKLKYDFSSKNETFQILEFDCENPHKGVANSKVS